ncbi:MAG: hypothetical protein ACYTXY_55865, partial [Nostoc sp.]
MALPSDSIWFRKSNFFTLVVELAKHINQIPDNVVERLTNLELLLLDNRNKPDNKYGKYYSYMYAGTTNRKGRVVRAEVFN